jgi:NADPH-dependent ferric siderophore reductase
MGLLDQVRPAGPFRQWRRAYRERMRWQWHAGSIMREVQHPTRTGQFLTIVTGLVALSPRMRRITLTSPQIAQQSWPLGCDIAIVLGGADREIRRRYTVRAVTGDQLLVDAVLHGHGPGSAWAQSLQLGDPVRFFGPRGQIPLAEVDWWLALTDESGLPAVAALAEAALAGHAAGMTEPARTMLVRAEIADLAEQYPLPAGVDVQWLPRAGRPAGTLDLLAEALDRLELPAGAGQAYLLGESRAVVVLRDQLGRRGLDRAAIYAKGYWNLNSRPTR